MFVPKSASKNTYWLNERLATKYPTGALATLDLPGEWRNLGWGAGTLVAYVVPRELRAG